MCVARKIHAVEKERKKERSQTDHTRERERQRMKNKERIVARDGHRIRRIALKQRNPIIFFRWPNSKCQQKKEREKEMQRYKAAIAL